jgi:GxxExxY protein
MDIIYKQEVYDIVGICMEVHKQLGKGFLEIVYKDAIEYECQQRKYIYEREKEYMVNYKNIVLSHKFFADFIIFDKIILEVKGRGEIAEDFIGQTLNYLAASKLKVGLIVNFGNDSLEFKRVVL